MLNKPTLVLLNAVILVLTCDAIEEKNGCAAQTLYSRYAAGLDQSEAGIKSPDGKKMVTVRRVEDEKYSSGSYVAYRWRGEEKQLNARLDGFGAEVLWSPDSSAFAANQTEGGGGIGRRAYIFYPEKDHLHKIDVSAPVEKAFSSPVKCEVSVPPNTAVLKWLDSDRVLVVAEIVNVSICKCSGTFKTYEVSLRPLRVVRAYSQAETKRRFADSLGCELREADDACAKTWQ